FFRRFFGTEPERIPQRSLGSGVIVDPSGIALTNAHVVERATEIEVITLDGSKHKAKVVGVDKKTDLAVLRLDDGKGTFKFARLGNRVPDPLKQGEEGHTGVNGKGKGSGGLVGVLIPAVTGEVGESVGVQDKEGVPISDVVAESPAAKAGVKAGDIIVEYDGK